MIYLGLVLLGLALGSFVNAWVWRLYQQEEVVPKKNKKRREQLSIVRGRSMCTHCGHELATKDLVPVLSWLYLRGECRYCKKPIADTPLAELLTPFLLVLSYAVWPYAGETWSLLDITTFGIWAAISTCFVALAIYDAKWYLLPNRMVAPFTVLAALFAAALAVEQENYMVFVMAVAGGLVLSGSFLALSYLSKGTWIGGGDVKIGVSLGLLAGGPLMAVLVIFLASLLGSAVMLPSILRGKKGMTSMLPFGPFLIVATIVTVFWGQTLVGWYSNLLVQ